MIGADAGLGAFLAGEDEGTLEVLEAFIKELMAEKLRMMDVDTEEKFYERLAAIVVNPVLTAAEQDDDPRHALRSLVDLPEDNIWEEALAYLPDTMIPMSHALDMTHERERVMGRIQGAIDAHMTRKASEYGERGGDRDMQVMEWLYDIVKARRDGDKHRLGKVKGGLRTMFKSIRQYMTRQESIFNGMQKNVHTVRDVGIWYSRYALVPAIENARDGYIAELVGICHQTDDDIARDCAKLAQMLGIDAVEGDFDVAQVKKSMRQLCRARTGFSIP